jgi:hypothetical protein
VTIAARAANVAQRNAGQAINSQSRNAANGAPSANMARFKPPREFLEFSFLDSRRFVFSPMFQQQQDEIVKPICHSLGT